MLPKRCPTHNSTSVIIIVSNMSEYKKYGLLLLAIVTLPLHPLLGKMLKILTYGSDKKALGPAFTASLVMQPPMLSEHMCTPAEREHLRRRPSPTPFTHVCQYFVHKKRVAFNFPSLFVLDRVWYQGYAGLRERVGEYFDFFSVFWKRMCKIRVVAPLKVYGRIHI